MKLSFYVKRKYIKIHETIDREFFKNLSNPILDFFFFLLS